LDVLLPFFSDEKYEWFEIMMNFVCAFRILKKVKDAKSTPTIWHREKKKTGCVLRFSDSREAWK